MICTHARAHNITYLLARARAFTWVCVKHDARRTSIDDDSTGGGYGGDRRVKVDMQTALGLGTAKVSELLRERAARD